MEAVSSDGKRGDDRDVDEFAAVAAAAARADDVAAAAAADEEAPAAIVWSFSVGEINGREMRSFSILTDVNLPAIGPTTMFAIALGANAVVGTGPGAGVGGGSAAMFMFMFVSDIDMDPRRAAAAAAETEVGSEPPPSTVDELGVGVCGCDNIGSAIDIEPRRAPSDDCVHIVIELRRAPSEPVTEPKPIWVGV